MGFSAYPDCEALYIKVSFTAKCPHCGSTLTCRNMDLKKNGVYTTPEYDDKSHLGVELNCSCCGKYIIVGLT